MPKITTTTTKNLGEGSGLFTEKDDIVNLLGWNYGINDDALGGNDQVHLTNYKDVFRGGLGRDIIWAEGGDDIIYETKIFGDKDDTLNGGAGTDTIDYSGFDNTGTLGPLEIHLENGYARVMVKPIFQYDRLVSMENAVGSQYGDEITGSTLANSLYGGGGNDTLNGAGGNDVLVGGAGNDSLLGGTGDDYLEGGSDNNTLLGGTGDDYFKIGAGNNYITGDNGNYLDAFGGGFDTVDYSYSAIGLRASFGKPGSTIVVDSAGNPIIPLTAIHGDGVTKYTDTYAELNFIDKVIGSHYDDMIVLGSSMTIKTGTGNDHVFGVLDDFGNLNYEVFLGEGADKFNAGGLNYVSVGGYFTIHGEAGNDDIALMTGHVIIDGGEGDDSLMASNGLVGNSAESAVIYGGNGKDNIGGSKGNDALYGGAGTDEIHGGSGDDTIDGGAGGTSYSYTEDLIGNEGNDLIISGGGIAILFGGDGDDTLVGGDNGGGSIIGNGGDDLIVVGTGSKEVYGDFGIYSPAEEGADTFVLSLDCYVNFSDYEDGVDKFDCSAFGISFSDLVVTTHPVGNSAYVSVVYMDGTYVLPNVSNASIIDASDFIF